MDPLLRQVGDLLLGAVPTATMFLLLYAIYSALVGNPLRKLLDERRQRPEGGVLKARADIAPAESKTQEYEQRMREARLAIFKAQEVRRQAAQKARAAAVAEARERAQQQIREARAAIDQDMAIARQSLKAESEALASEIIPTILKPPGSTSAGGGRDLVHFPTRPPTVFLFGMPKVFPRGLAMEQKPPPATPPAQTS